MQISDLVGQYHQTTTSGTDKLTGTKGVENLVASLRSLTKGNIFEGTVSSMEGKVPLSVGQSMFFQVKSNDGTQIAIRPFVVDGNGVNYTLMTALNVAGLAVDSDHLSMVNRMMQEQMPIDRNSLQQMARLVSANPDIDVQTLVVLPQVLLGEVLPVDQMRSMGEKILSVISENLPDVPEQAVSSAVTADAVGEILSGDQLMQQETIEDIAAHNTAETEV